MPSLDEEKMLVWKILNTAREYLKGKSENVVEDRYPTVDYATLCEIAGFSVRQRTLRIMIWEGSIFFHHGGYSIAEQWDSEREAKRGGTS